MEAGAVVREGGEVGLGSAAAEAVVGCGPGWGEEGSEIGVRGWEGGMVGEEEGDTWLSRRVCRVPGLGSSCVLLLGAGGLHCGVLQVEFECLDPALREVWVLGYWKTLDIWYSLVLEVLYVFCCSRIASASKRDGAHIAIAGGSYCMQWYQHTPFTGTTSSLIL